MTRKKLHKKVKKFIEKIYINGYLDGMEYVEKEYKIQQKYIDNGDDSCESCMYTDRKSCEEPCVSCSHNHVNHWRLDETAD